MNLRVARHEKRQRYIIMALKYLGSFRLISNRMAFSTPKTYIPMGFGMELMTNIRCLPGEWHILRKEASDNSVINILAVHDNRDPACFDFSKTYKLLRNLEPTNSIKLYDQMNPEHGYTVKIPPLSWELRGDYANGNRPYLDGYENNWLLMQARGSFIWEYITPSHAVKFFRASTEKSGNVSSDSLGHKN